jgi:hypothetical protein
MAASLGVRVSPSRVRDESQSRESAGSQLSVAEPKAAGSSGTQRKGNVCRWKPLPNSVVKTVIENTSMCVWCRFLMCSHVLFKSFKSSIHPITNPNPFYSHNLSRENMFFLHCFAYSLS